MNEPLPTEIPMSEAFAQIPTIDEQSRALDRKIGVLVNEVYLLEDEILRINRRIATRNRKIHELARRRTEVLNFQLPLSAEENGAEEPKTKTDAVSS